MTDRLRYTKEEITQWFDRVALPEQKRVHYITDLSDAEKLDYLCLLLKHTLIRIPFENLTQHYSWHRTINVRPQHLFNKIVRQPRRRGGYCMEANSLFHTVLLSLGFQVFIAGARVYNSAAERYGGFSHCNNIVIIGGERWMVDVGFGANGPTIPLPLRHDEPQTHIQGTPSLVRLMYESIPQNVDQGQKLWIYQHRLNHDPTSKWTPMYCFVDFEFLLEDINGMNLSPWKSPHSWFTQKVVLTRFTTDSEILHRDVDTPQITSEGTMTEGSIDGTLILFQDTVKWRRGGETKLQIKLESEEDRIGALWKYFDIELEDEDREAIRGTVSEIKCEFRPFG